VIVEVIGKAMQPLTMLTNLHYPASFISYYSSSSYYYYSYYYYYLYTPPVHRDKPGPSGGDDGEAVLRVIEARKRREQQARDQAREVFRKLREQRRKEAVSREGGAGAGTGAGAGGRGRGSVGRDSAEGASPTPVKKARRSPPQKPSQSPTKSPAKSPGAKAGMSLLRCDIFIYFVYFM
jgi:hypothetical protein